ncbi:hypothetical protein [Corynebacterium sp. ES2775-CONJ]|uniref:hypothetical protein n=1 Tax=Corynebacterium sp. ES2775-CONJ TaxID=2974029 RepID=UPI0021685B82|nr:hypothetical protein [Corynebacterium sp. ES2775-CONJ]MCS4490310.1 hypothetical protein [Corynebacterium sp. ES2775-CONJ]
MRTKTKILSLLVGTSLVATNLATAAAAGQTFEVTGQNTAAEVQAAIANPDYDLIKFTEDLTLSEGLTVNRPVNFEVEDGITLKINAANKPGLDFVSGSTFQNNGIVNITATKNPGIKVTAPGSTDGVTLIGDSRDGSAFNIGPIGSNQAGIDGQFLKSPFTVSDTSLNIKPGNDNAFVSAIFSDRNNPDATVLFDNSNVSFEMTNRLETVGRWKALAFYTELPTVFRHSAVTSTSSRGYNMSAVSMPGRPADLTFENSVANLITTPDAVAHPLSFTFPFFGNAPLVSINTSKNTVTIKDSVVTSSIQSGLRHEDFQFQCSHYDVSGTSVVTGDSLGVDPKQNRASLCPEPTSTLTISDDVIFNVPGGSAPDGLDITIDGGTVDLPDGATAVNSKDQALTEFVSEGSFTPSVDVNCGADTYEYPVSNSNIDGKKHVWAPAVTVDYFLPNDVKQDNLDSPFATRTLIAGTTVDQTLNFTDPSDKGPVQLINGAVPDDGKIFQFYIFAPTDLVSDAPFIQESDGSTTPPLTATTVCKDIKVTYKQVDCNCDAETSTPTSTTSATPTTSTTTSTVEPQPSTTSATPTTSTTTSTVEPQPSTTSATPTTSTTTSTVEPQPSTSTTAPATSTSTTTPEPQPSTTTSAPATSAPSEPTGSSTGSSDDGSSIGSIIGIIFAIIGAMAFLYNLPNIFDFFKGLLASPKPAPEPAPHRPIKPGISRGKGFTKSDQTR